MTNLFTIKGGILDKFSSENIDLSSLMLYIFARI